MRLRASVVFGAAIGLATLLLLYQLVSLPPDTSTGMPNQYEALQSRLKHLEEDINVNQNTIKEINRLLDKINNPVHSNIIPKYHPKLSYGMSESAPVALPPSSQKLRFNTTLARIHSDDCNFAQTSTPNVDILVEEVYRELPFDNPDGGVWKQGWDITYERSQWTADKPLKVFVVPHSHCDPGWLKTYVRYFDDQVSHIFENMVPKLEVDPRRRFIYAEISFFSMWWEKQTPTMKQRVKKLISQGQLELVTGGWVMPDEATTHYWSIVDQLVTGHEWLRTQLNYRPNNGWAIDPFGLSPTMAYILKRSGLENMLIQRGHYVMKKYLAANKNLEFRWRQSWDPDTSTEILCQLMPFYSYDVPHTCGPDPKICCQFDFRRLPGSRMTCPWRVPPQPITPHNVKSRAELLLDQYRKKSQLFRTNVLLVPLGDDFRYDTAEEWDAQFTNYQSLFDHINSHSDYNVQAQFGTLSDYFHALREESRSMQPGGGGTAGEDEEAIFPSLSGDFFTYADRDDHYWSGYFTSRPFYKARSRVLASKLRATEVLFSLALGTVDTTGPRISKTTADVLHEKLSEAHKALGLFQHHDGITGTSKDHVVIDYANKLMHGIELAEHVLQFTTHAMLAPSSSENDLPDAVFLEMSEEHMGVSAVSVPKVLKLGEPGKGAVILYNSHPHTYNGIITVRVDSHLLKVISSTGNVLFSQIDPVFGDSSIIEFYDVHFPVELKPLSLSRFVLTRSDEVNSKVTHFATVTVVNQFSPKLPKEFVVNRGGSDKPEEMTAGSTTAVVGKDGFIQSITKEGSTTKFNIQFVSYRAKQGGEMSGAYLFLPSGVAQAMTSSSPPPIRIVQGPLRSLLVTKMPLFTHTFAISNTPGIDSISIRNFINVKPEKNFELAMRIITDVDSKDTFYTDLNGFQIIRRERHDKLTLQGNYYPVASQIFIEDEKKRVTLLTAQPHGGSSLSSGYLEVMQDRRLMQDDHRGLEQGVTDNLVTPNEFRIVIEERAHALNPDDEGKRSKNVFPSLAAENALQELLYPPVVLHNTYKSTGLRQSWSASTSGVACDIQLVSMRSLRGEGGAVGGSSAALTLRRNAFDCSYPPPRMSCSTDGGKVQLNDILGSAYAEEVRQTTLSHMYVGVNITKSFTLTLQPMELYTFLLSPANVLKNHF